MVRKTWVLFLFVIVFLMSILHLDASVIEKNKDNISLFQKVVTALENSLFIEQEKDYFTAEFAISAIANYASTDVPITISPTTINTVSSTLNINAPGLTVQDLNLNLNISHAYVGDLEVTLISPSGTSVLVYDNTCGGDDNIILTIDDGQSAIPCPPNDNNSHQGANLLSIFSNNNETINGTWTLQVSDNYAADGGSIDAWSLDITTNSTSGGGGGGGSTSDPCTTFAVTSIDFEADPNGNAISAGTTPFETYAAWGLHITSDSPTNHPPMIFDSSNPSGGDVDLGTPNQNFGGPGIGDGGETGQPGENSVAYGNLMIISTNNNSSDPNDHAGGGTITFNFDQDVSIVSFIIIDLDFDRTDGRARCYDAANNLISTTPILAYGNNSYQKVAVGTSGVRRLEVSISTSFSIGELFFCDDNVPTASIGDLVWNDVNGDGLPIGEPGIPGVKVYLRNSSNEIIGETYTDSEGYYSFDNIATPRDYIVTIDTPTGYENTFDLDSDADANSGVFTLAADEEKMNVDFGIRDPNAPDNRSCDAAAYTASGDVSNGPISKVTDLANGTYVNLNGNRYLVATLSGIIPVGTEYTIHMASEDGTTAGVDVWEAPAGTSLPTFQTGSPSGFTNNGQASIAGTTITQITKTALVPTKYIYLDRSQGNPRVDAITFTLDCGTLPSCENPLPFTWGSGTSGNDWQITNGQTSITRDYTIAGETGNFVTSVTLNNPDGQNIDFSNCGTAGNHFYTATCNATNGTSDCDNDAGTTDGQFNYGCDYLTMGMTSTNSDDFISMEFDFAEPVEIYNYLIADIDYQGNGSAALESWQDEVDVTAFYGTTPVELSAISGGGVIVSGNNTTALNLLSIYGGGTGGNISPNSGLGHAYVTTSSPITRLIIRYSNGPDDEGTSDDHAIRVSGFDYCPALSPEVCEDGVDNDGNGLTDCEDLASNCGPALSNITVSPCQEDNLGDIATLSLDVEWTTAPAGANLMIRLGKTNRQIINVSGGASSPQSLTFTIPADGSTNNPLSIEWSNVSETCDRDYTYDAPNSCSGPADRLGCTILYLCGDDKPEDGDAWDHGAIEYINANNTGGSLTPAFTKNDASGLGLYDPMNNSVPLSIDVDDYSLIIVSPTTEARVAADLIAALRDTRAAVLLQNYLLVNDLGMSNTEATYSFQTNLYIDNSTSAEIYNYNNVDANYGEVMTGANYLANADAYLWFNAGDQAAGTNGVYFSYEETDALPGVPATHGKRVYLGYHMNGLYYNAENGGAMPAPIEEWLVPATDFTTEGKDFWDDALLDASSKCACAFDVEDVSLTSCIANAGTVGATVEIEISWLPNVTDNINVTANGSTQTINVSSASSPTTLSFNIPADDSVGNPITVLQSATGCEETATYDTPSTCGANAGDCPGPTVNAGANITVCEGETVNLSATASQGDGNFTYSWDNGLGAGQNHSFVGTASATANSVTDYLVTATDGNDCTATDIVRVTVRSNPDVSFTSTDAHCGQSDGSITFSFTDNANRTNIRFSINNGANYPYSSNDNAGSLTVSNLATGNYSLSARWGDSSCPISLGTESVNDLSGPNVNAGNDENVCGGESITINAVGNGGTGGLSYTWDNGLGSGQSKIVYPTTNTTYTVTVTDDFACTNTDVVTVTVLPYTDPACSPCIDPADADGDGVCASEDCADDDPTIPAPAGTSCNDGNAFTTNDVIQEDECSCQGEPIPCTTTLDVLLQQPDYDDNGTPANISDDTFTFEATIIGSGSTWSANGQTGNYGQTVTFGPYNVDNVGITFDVLDQNNPNCRENISVNISSCIYSGVCTCCN